MGVLQKSNYEFSSRKGINILNRVLKQS